MAENSFLNHNLTKAAVGPDDDASNDESNRSIITKSSFPVSQLRLAGRRMQPVEEVGGRGWPSHFTAAYYRAHISNIAGVDTALYGTFNMHVIDKYFILFNIHYLDS